MFIKQMGAPDENFTCESGSADNVLEFEERAEIRIEKGVIAAAGAADGRGDAAQTL
jgi:hypothetical protein